MIYLHIYFSKYCVQSRYPDVCPIGGDSPFIQVSKEGLSGPYVDAFARLAQQQEIKIHFQAKPMRRLLKIVTTEPNSCGLAVHFSAENAETLRYVARIAPITLAVYARQGTVKPLSNIEALRNYRIGAIDVAELREILDNAAIRYELLPKAGQGIAMLQAGRFDLLISDVLPELVSAPAKGKPVQRVMVLARVERWLACHPQLPPNTVKRLRAALTLGVFDDAMADIWKQYGLSSVYNGVRREWILIP
ncbi:hypothetical protein BJP24_05960 [Aeromonas allosaccharophila]|uniref:hypothetical protein n=1 Tax=Aeromonas allosaccharophila TaxID=656 RepID=UPI0005B2231E|nr:hypothetical protein [Aeromonas allosaccharophila]OKP45448.1 hypothetical protein BJP24_05960 [Aeromonas allosaccharophila]